MIKFRPVKCAKCGGTVEVCIMAGICARGECVSCNRIEIVYSERGYTKFHTEDYWKPLVKELRKRFKVTK